MQSIPREVDSHGNKRQKGMVVDLGQLVWGLIGFVSFWAFLPFPDLG